MADKVTIDTVARRARVSRQTVSNVLNAPHLVREQTRARVREAIEALGYRASQAARQMRTGRSRLIAARIEPVLDGISGSVSDRFLHGLTEAAAPAGYRVMLYTASDDSAEIATFDDLLRGYDLDAFVLTSTHHADPRTAWLAGRGVPFVTFGRPWSAGPGADLPAHSWVDVDGAAGTAEATARLLAAGHRRIGFLGWPAGSGVGDDRRCGWAATLAKAGLDGTGRSRAIQDRVVDGERAARQLLAEPDPPTALVCVSDSLALGALQAVRAGAGGAGPARSAVPGPAGPDQVAVIGFDDTPVAQAVGLTSVRQPLALAASRCLELLVDALETGRAQPRQILLPPQLVARASG